EPLGPFARDRLDADAARLGEADLLDAHLALEERDDLLHLRSAGRPLDARVDVLRVLAEDHHVDLVGALDGARDALEPAHGPEADVEVEDLAERDVERADAAADGRRERALDAHPELLERGDRLVRKPVAEAVERLLAGVDLAPGDLPLAAVRLLDRGVEDALRGAPDVGAGAVALDEGEDRTIGHRELPVRPHADRLAVLRHRNDLVRRHG